MFRAQKRPPTVSYQVEDASVVVLLQEFHLPFRLLIRRHLGPLFEFLLSLLVGELVQTIELLLLLISSKGKKKRNNRIPCAERRFLLVAVLAISFYSL